EINVQITADTPDEDTDLDGWIEAEPASGSNQPPLRIPFYVPVHFMQVHVSPNPAFQKTEAFIYSPVGLSEVPEITVESPSGNKKKVDAFHDHDLWWRAPINLDEAGIYRISTTGTTEEGITLTGTSFMESQSGEKEIGWKPIGPNGMGGNQLLDLGQEGLATVDTVQPGMFLSADDLSSWKELRNFPMAGGLPRKAAVDPQDPDTIYV